jgi:hypothetical protein
MVASNWTEADSQKAQQIWAEYQCQHNVADRLGQTAGIDPQTQQVWFGTSAADIVRQRDTQGLRSPLFFVRVGSDTYLRKGRGR